MKTTINTTTNTQSPVTANDVVKSAVSNAYGDQTSTANYAFLSGDINPMPIESCDRRYFLVRPSKT